MIIPTLLILVWASASHQWSVISAPLSSHYSFPLSSHTDYHTVFMIRMMIVKLTIIIIIILFSSSTIPHSLSCSYVPHQTHHIFILIFISYMYLYVCKNVKEWQTRIRRDKHKGCFGTKDWFSVRHNCTMQPNVT